MESDGGFDRLKGRLRALLNVMSHHTDGGDIHRNRTGAKI